MCVCVCGGGRGGGLHERSVSQGQSSWRVYVYTPWFLQGVLLACDGGSVFCMRGVLFAHNNKNTPDCFSEGSHPAWRVHTLGYFFLQGVLLACVSVYVCVCVGGGGGVFMGGGAFAHAKNTPEWFRQSSPPGSVVFFACNVFGV